MNGFFRFLLLPVKGLFYLVMGFLLSIPITCVLLLVFSNYWIAPVAEHIIEQKTTFATNVEKSEISIVDGDFLLKNIVISNPSSFDIRDGAFLKEFDFKLNWKSFLNKYIEVEKMVIDIQNITWVRTKNKEINVENFMKNLPFISEQGMGFFKNYLIDSFTIRIGTIKVVDYADVNRVREFRVNYSRQFSNILKVEDKNISVDKSIDVNTVRTQIADDLNRMGFNFLIRSLYACFNK